MKKKNTIFHRWKKIMAICVMVALAMPKRSQNVPEEYTAYERAVAEAMGARVRQGRKALKLTQEQVRIRMEAESISVTQTQFSRIENGESLLSAAEVIALAVALELPFEWLLLGRRDDQRGG